MELLKLIILLCCTWHSFASHHSHTIPVEGYETDLQVLGQHVDIPETPVKVVKITKTVAVKIPVPYPVKIIEKVPYPVHVAKPYPVPVPQIIKVPHIVSPKQGNSHNDAGNDYGGSQASHQGNSYSVDEVHEPSDDGASFDALSNLNSYNGGNSGYNRNLGSHDDEYSAEDFQRGSYEAPTNNYYSNSNTNNLESKNYDQALNQYFHNQNPTAQFNSGNNENYH